MVPQSSRFHLFERLKFMAKENRTKPGRRLYRKKGEASKGFVNKVIAGPNVCVIGSIASKVVHREILFPTEPTSIDPRRIDRAIERVMSRRK
jgi:hypothetical protein